MGIRFLYTVLTEDAESFLNAVRTRAALIRDAVVGPDRDLQEVVEAMKTADLVVTAAEDVRRGDDPEGNRELLVETLSALGVPSGHILPIDTRRLEDGLPIESARAIADSAQPVVFAFGSVTGWTLRRLRDTVRQLGGPMSRPRGLVLHSRPQSVREWQAIRSMFDGECAYIWQTFLPWDSPLRHEADLLSEFVQHLDDSGIELDCDVAEFAATRKHVSDPPDQVAEWSERVARYAQGGDAVHPATVFWGPSLRQPRADRGAFGRQLDHISTYVAVASAIHRTRVEGESREGPFWRAFSIRDAVTRRYDGITLAAMLRWLDATEAWWGDTAMDATETAHLVRSFMGETPEEYETFLPEVLLATAMGKVHPAAARSFCIWAQELLDDDRLGPSLKLGLELIKWARPTGVD